MISKEHTGIRERLKLITGSGSRFPFLCVGEDAPDDKQREYISGIRNGGIGMRFTEGSLCALETLMQEIPGNHHYDDGCDGRYPECRNCRYHTPYFLRGDCMFGECPYLFPGESSGRKKGGGGHGCLPR